MRFDTRLRAQPQGRRRRKQNGATAQNLLEYNWENPRREKQYILPMFVPGSAEFFNMNKRQIADRPEVTTFFERMTFLPLEHITAMVPPGGAGIGMHVIPVEKAIETENRSADIEHISHWLKNRTFSSAATSAPGRGLPLTRLLRASRGQFPSTALCSPTQA